MFVIDVCSCCDDEADSVNGDEPMDIALGCDTRCDIGDTGFIVSDRTVDPCGDDFVSANRGGSREG